MFQSYRLLQYGLVLFLAGGSGVTSTLGQLDDLVGRWVRGGHVKRDHTRQVEWVWCVRDAGNCFTFSDVARH
jgi:ferredoxin-NADP reductase